MFGGSVVGLSSLRQHQPKSTEPSAKAKELQSYLAKYSGEKAGDSSKVKKKKKKTARPQPGGVRIFEEDNTGFHKSSVPEELDAEDEGQPVLVCVGYSGIPCLCRWLDCCAVCRSTSCCQPRGG